jgi:hypothetical protein
METSTVVQLLQRILIGLATSSNADLSEHFGRWTIEARQRYVADVPQIFTSLRCGVEPASSQVAVSREELRGFDEARLSFLHQTDVIADRDLLRLREFDE